jgi:ABC-type phosphate transport system substrate-binding protein
MHAIPVVAFALILVGSGQAIVAQTSTSRSAYRVIVHPNNPITTVNRKFIEDAFLKKATRWSHDEVIRPVDLNSDSVVRQQFSKEVLQRSVPAVKSYWQQLIFSGRDVPPPELDAEEDVVKYVLKHPGGIGYVSSSTNIGGAKAVTLE